MESIYAVMDFMFYYTLIGLPYTLFIVGYGATKEELTPKILVSIFLAWPICLPITIGDIVGKIVGNK